MMASCSLNEKPLYSYVVATSRLAERQSSSEASSASPSLEGSDNDNEAAAEKLGVANLSHLGAERFQIDRRRLEKMIKTPGTTEGKNSAECFFQNIMKTTDTFITWPRNLKLGARSRKDPYIRIVGRPDDNTWAKGLILASLATRGPLLKMKMAISNLDHPHIIGRGGYNINRIMEETETHVHFPDSNMRNLVEKNNQVSMYGSADGLERARVSLRMSTPLLISFEMPIRRPMPRHDTPFVKNIEMQYNVKVIFFSSPKPDAYLVLVKGSEEDAAYVKQAVKILINYTCGVMAHQTLVSIQLEMSQQLYDIITVDNPLLMSIMEATQTAISFPNPSEMSQHSQVTIIGRVDGVYEAKQQLLGCLPIEVTFDVSGENQRNTAQIMALGNKYGVKITMQYKQRDNSITITIKAMEQSVQHIYQAQQEILDMQIITTNEPDIPKAYYLQEPAYRQSLENNINSDQSQYDGVFTEIWAPTGQQHRRDSNFMLLPQRADTSNEFQPGNINVTNSTHLDQQLQSEVRAILTPDSTDSSEAGYQNGRRSCDWVVMKAASEDETRHFECDFDAEDLEVAMIFMSSPINNLPLFPAAPGSERQGGW